MKVECGEVYDRYTIISTPGSSQRSQDTSSVNVAPYMLYPSHARFLLVSGLFFDAADCGYSKAVQAELRNQMIEFDVMDFEKNDFIAKLSSGNYSCCILFGVGSDGGGCLKVLYLPEIQSVLTTWVKCGGKLIMQGEGCLMKIFKDWFDKPWYFKAYCRQSHTRNDSDCFVPQCVRNYLPHEYNVKATLISNVSPEDSLYSSDEDHLCSVAVSGFHLGRVAYIGDVNWEQPTIEIIVAIGSTAFNTEDENWIRRRSFASFVAGIRLTSEFQDNSVGTQGASKVLQQNELAKLVVSFL